MAFKPDKSMPHQHATDLEISHDPNLHAAFSPQVGEPQVSYTIGDLKRHLRSPPSRKMLRCLHFALVLRFINILGSLGFIVLEIYLLIMYSKRTVPIGQTPNNMAGYWTIGFTGPVFLLTLVCELYASWKTPIRTVKPLFPKARMIWAHSSIMGLIMISIFACATIVGSTQVAQGISASPASSLLGSIWLAVFALFFLHGFAMSWQGYIGKIEARDAEKGIHKLVGMKT